MKKWQNLTEFKESVRILYEAKKEKEEMEKHLERVKKKETLKISNWMFCNLPESQKSVEIELNEGKLFYDNHVKVRVTKKQNKRIIWDVHTMKQIFSKSILKQIIVKNVTVTDWDGLVQLMKKYHVNPNEFKAFFSVSETVNEKALENLSDTGVIKDKHLEQCYTVTMGDPYIVIKEL